MENRTRLPVAIALILFPLGIALVYAGFPPHVVIDWETSSEVSTVAFLLYRGESADGPFSLLATLPADGDPLTGTSYHYDDEDVVWGRRYSYRLEEVDRDGNRSLFPDVVEGQAGAGWPLALAAAALLAGTGLLSGRRWIGARAARAGGSHPERVHSER